MLETNIYFQDLDIGNQKKNIIILHMKILKAVVRIFGMEHKPRQRQKGTNNAFLQKIRISTFSIKNKTGGNNEKSGGK